MQLDSSCPRASTDAQRKVLEDKIQALKDQKTTIEAQALAAKVEISVGNLSEIERGLSVPSIRTLCLLSKALDIGAGWLLDLHAESGRPIDPYVVRASTRQSIVYSKAGVVKRLASPLSPGQLQMLLVEIEPATKRVVWTFDQFERWGNSVSNTKILDRATEKR